MHRSITTVVALAILVVGHSAAAQRSGTASQLNPEMAKHHLVFGVVSSGGLGVAGATVSAPGLKAAAGAEPHGSYRLVIAPGHHELVFSAPGYRTEKRFVNMPRYRRVQLHVQLSPLGTKRMAGLPKVFASRKYDIVGLVTSRGQTVPGAVVKAPDARANRFSQAGLGTEVIVNGDGAYAFDLNSGRHELVFSAPGYRPVRKIVTKPKGQLRLDIELEPEAR